MPEETLFEITEDHLKLLHHLNFRYEDGCEFGAAAVCPKRPYGNSDVYGDIGAILDISASEDGSYPEEVEEVMLGLHKGMTTVLQIIAFTGSVKTGRYRGTYYGTKWEAV